MDTKLGSFSGKTAAGFYFTMAVSMGFINKATLSEYAYSNTLLLIQMVITFIVIKALSYTNVITLQDINKKTLLETAPLALFYNANVAFALAGLQRLNIPMYQTLKRLTPCVVCVIRGLLGKGWPDSRITTAVLTITGGTIVAGLGDFNFDLAAYSYAIISCLLQAIYLLLAEAGGEKGLSSTELLLYNSVLSIPVLVVVVMLTEGQDSFNALSSSDHPVWLFSLILGSSAMGGILNYALFLCTTTNSALTTTIVGVMKAVAMTSLGFFLLGGVSITPLNFTGIILNTAGGCYYSRVKYVMKEEEAQKENRNHVC